MALWKFVHETLGMHLFVISALVVAALIVIVAVVHGINQKRRETKFQNQLQDQPLGADPGAGSNV